ncbi:glucose-6-phosphate isomerase [Methanospirillum lacunae]|uniref:glucose-6-phosphate isomerase n=1 Tax=Methanospirillum lacunae TaxID=668570 RepID=A0A2V2N9Q0_9EURY|nr:glucose-6-phosphate isomerase [Methanospirillum lacunae]
MADPSCVCEGPLYEMYRGVCRNNSDKEWFDVQQIRYDVTRIPSRTICKEWIKTKGHYHPLSPDGLAYPEIYEVLEGAAYYLLQKRDLSDIVLVRAEKGDLILIPPGYGHITVNPTMETLTMANLVSSAFASQYLPYEELKGGAYYIFSDGGMKKNPAYPADIPDIRIVDATGTHLPEPFPDKSLYDLVGDVMRLRFLNHPREFEDLYPGLYLYT